MSAMSVVGVMRHKLSFAVPGICLKLVPFTPEGPQEFRPLVGNPAAPCNPPAACPPDTFGKNCSSLCTCQNGGTCDPVSGACRCPPGVSGAHCEDGACSPSLGNSRGRGSRAVSYPSYFLGLTHRRLRLNSMGGDLLGMDSLGKW